MSADVQEAVSRVAGAIGDSSRARMLCCLMDGRARTSTELAIAAGVSRSMASEHVARLRREKLVKLYLQGRHRYCSLAGPEIASILEQLCVGVGTRVPSIARCRSRREVIASSPAD